MRNNNKLILISNVMRNIFGIFGCFCWAFASTANSMASNIIGQGRQNEVIDLIKKILTISLSLAFFIVVVLNIFPGAFLSLFGQGDLFVKEGIPVLRVVSTALLLSSIATIFLSTVTASGNTRITFMIEAGAIVTYCAYIYIVLEHFHYSIVIGWISEWIYWLCLLIPSFLYLRSNKWRNKTI